MATLPAHFAERVQKSVAHLNLISEAQLFIKGGPHLTEHGHFACKCRKYSQLWGSSE